MGNKNLFHFCLSLGCLAFCSVQMLAVDVHKIVPMASDTSLKVEVHLSVKAGDHFSINGHIAECNQENTSLWKGSFGKYTFKETADTTVIVELANLAPKRWSPVSPTLYSLDVTVGSHQLSKRIGFRKFEMIDGQFHLNGKPIYLRGNAINPPNRGIPEELEASKEFARDYVRFMKSIHINMIRIPENQNWLDVCDEEGMMIFAGRYGKPKGGTESAPPTDFEKSVETYKNRDLGPFTSHPSVMIYIMSNETPYSGKAGDLYREFFSRMHQVLKAWDDSRLYICNAGYGLGKSADIYDVHRYWGWYYNTFLTYLNMRDQSMWQNPGKIQPITFTECVGNYTGIDGRYNLCSRTKQPNSQKCWTGHLPDSLQAEAALTYQAFVLKNATEMFRRFRSQNNRLAGTMPFTIMFYNWDGIRSFADMGAKPVANQYRISYQPILLSFENWQTQVYAGNTVPVVAHVVNDDDDGKALTGAEVQWRLEGNGKKVASGKLVLPIIPYYETFRKEFSLNIPAELPTGMYTLKGEIKTGNKVVSLNETDYFIAGNDWKQSVQTSGNKLYVYDSKGGATTKALSLLGYQISNFTRVTDLPSSSVLVIGENSWDHALATQISELKNYITKGGRVLCMRQNEVKFDTSWLPVTVKMLQYSNNSAEYLSPAFAYEDGMNINLERPYHPVFKNLRPEWFKLWSDYTQFDESRPGFPAVYPVTAGYDLIGSDFSKVAVLANYSRGLAATGLAELFAGKGSVLLSGFDMAGRCGVDPVSDRFLMNMVDYLRTEKSHPIHVAITDSIVWGDFASEKGIVAGAYSGLMLNTTPIVPIDKKDKYPLIVDEYGYQFAGSYGGWNSKPGVLYVPNGRRATAPFTFSKGGNTVIKKGTEEGEGFFYVSIPKQKRLMSTTLENVVDEELHFSIQVNGSKVESITLSPKQKTVVSTQLPKHTGDIKVSFKGDRRAVLLKTEFR